VVEVKQALMEVTGYPTERLTILLDGAALDDESPFNPEECPEISLEVADEPSEMIRDSLTKSTTEFYFCMCSSTSYFNLS
jgi:hypothetical protein